MSHEALIARLEALIGSDRELDAEIDVALFGGETIWKTANYTMESYPASRRPSATHIGGFANEHVPSYTASLDAAVALVERVLPGWTYLLNNDGVRKDRACMADLFPPNWPLGKNYEATHRQMPIAICIATLLALQENSNER